MLCPSFVVEGQDADLQGLELEVVRENNRIYRPTPISGYPEWLPEQRLVELRWIDQIRDMFELYGFCSVETPSVEEINVITAQGGDTDKEIYALRRLNESDQKSEPRVALHHDLTVPLARYVAMHYNDLVMPFKRYQIQRVWRGERPQEGRFREFYQCDIDIADNDSLSIHFDAELPMIISEILNSLHIGPYTIHINNRKILQGFYEGLGIKDVVGAIRIADKIDKIGREGVQKSLVDDIGLPTTIAEQCINLSEIKTPGIEFVDSVRRLGSSNDILETGLSELRFVIERFSGERTENIFADLSIARGFDYYTGTVYEGKLTDFPSYPSICSGGRYDNLVGGYLNKKLPGVGMSIGLTRIFAKFLKEGLIPLSAKCPTELLVVYPKEADYETVNKTANSLRKRGIKVETYHEPHKLQKQLKYASRKGINYVWFPCDGGKPDEVKDMRTGEQFVAAVDWRPAKSG